MQPADWLLVFIHADPERAADPVRLQKGMFLLAMRGVQPAGEQYGFEPYAYGPMSRGLYDDLRALGRDGLVTFVPVARAQWQAVRLTASGRRYVEQLPASPSTLAEVRALRRELDGLTFAALLERVYREFPEYAVNSVFRQG